MRWQVKKVPVLRDISIAIDGQFLKSMSGERPDADPDGVDAYFEGYVSILEKQVHGRVLELGSGHGYVTRRLAKNPAVTAIVATDKIKEFRFPDPKITFMQNDLTHAVLPSGFDVVIATEFIEHISEKDLSDLLPRVRDALKSGGVFIGSTPNNPTPYKKFSGSPFHVREYNRRDLAHLLEASFVNVAVRPISEYCLIWKATKE